MTIKFNTDWRKAPSSLLAYAELHFDGGALDGMKLIGFSVHTDARGRKTVQFPARVYSLNGERLQYALLRPHTDQASQERLTAIILQAYADWQDQLADELASDAPSAAGAPGVASGRDGGETPVHFLGEVR